MKYEHITSHRQLTEFCDAISQAPQIAFDTEFVSEDTYRPDLCLIQVAAAGQLAVIDTLACPDVNCFWELLAEPGHETIVHAGREEFRFCQLAIGKRPAGWMDVQIAAGIVGLEYPAAYSTLIHKLLGKNLDKGETRTNWRARPLSERQIKYALRDVEFLKPLRDKLVGTIEKRDRRDWLTYELETWQTQLEQVDQQPRWRRTSGISGLPPRALAVVREVWQWREAEAESRNQPPRRVLRDDLIVELARRQSADLRRIKAVRGMERRNLQRHLDDISQAVERALALGDDELPTMARRNVRPQLNLLAQFMSTAVNSLCREIDVSPALVGTVQDVRDLIAYHLKLDTDDTIPALAQGWRGDVVGHAIDDLLDGKLAIRITDPLSDKPLSFEQWQQGE